ncbi:hypothetical protein BJ085DRAFT_21191 [Dimargaris cristalligena]|uniref:Uncharacterized protein n=1 Tax=Dimargaris cristalligena TaxID=215637 RepID=A0A4V1J4Q1_9FUNG|nr:hypothetical protein BJ085DRAFT_21191 [Dimargaris cristalligena]|eukprot:RKP36339.1 hypothetical protein BJ085DRAFT_21191 [Dimargaris cristalligena]
MVSHLGVANQNTSSPVTAVAARNHTPNHHLNSSQNQTQSALSPEQVQRVDEIFFNFLQRICSDLNATDAKGETIHQTLMAKKMQKLEQTPDYRPFRFRIQAFTNAFQEELRRHGLSEEEIGIRKVKQYLWGQRHISRFNDDGNKSKSKGNHVWNVEAKKLPTGVWTFWQFSRRITPAPPKAIRIGSHFEWAPKVWDPQIQHPKVIFSSPGLPPWLNWADNVLSGVPGMDAQSFELKVNVQYCEKDIVPGRLEEKFTIMVTNSMDPNGGGGVAMNMSDFQLP